MTEFQGRIQLEISYPNVHLNGSHKTRNVEFPSTASAGIRDTRR